jgi:hypothetical protein
MRSFDSIDAEARGAIARRYFSEADKRRLHESRAPFYIIGARMGAYEGKPRAEFVLAFDLPEGATPADLAEIAADAQVFTATATPYRERMVAEIAGAGGEPVGPCILDKLPATNASGFVWAFAAAA